jgi:hypothetical protein
MRERREGRGKGVERREKRGWRREGGGREDREMREERGKECKVEGTP